MGDSQGAGMRFTLGILYSFSDVALVLQVYSGTGDCHLAIGR